ncbi:hypothetical protein [Dyadobacter psychrotolerans]|uniref:Uncharacterized protein n=1 Tax=Dyadobacter psychrotolerans TaxID=2541721 RepID=A0A4R5D6A6_9BACT|nr:hypothetical protein [Dyadobacter psychrotolerans]TDE09032.1 hypothetical protein E0F88_31615 [Dyadobacter psychrotolerans]
MATKGVLCILLIISYFQMQETDCEGWMKKLHVPDDGRIISFRYEKPPLVSGLGAGTKVQDSSGSYGDIFIALVINNNDQIFCSKIVKGDSALSAKLGKYLGRQTVTSAENYGRKVYSLMTVRIQFIDIVNGKSKRRKNRP